MRDEQGRSLPVLTKEQNGGIVADAVTLLAEEVLGPRYAQEMPAIADVVRRVVQGSTEVAHQVYRQGGPAVESPVEDARLRRAWAVLRADTAFNDLLEILRDNFVLTAVLSEPHVARRILKFSYISDYAPNGQARASQRLRSWLGLRQTHLIFLTPTATLASSYHFELAAPRTSTSSASLSMRCRMATTPVRCSSVGRPPASGPTTRRWVMSAIWMLPTIWWTTLAWPRCQE